MEKTVSWVYEERDKGVKEEEIRSTLEASGWGQEQITALLNAPRPINKARMNRKRQLLVFGAGATFMVLLFLLTLVLLGAIGSQKTLFTLENCLSTDIPDSACDSMQSLTQKDESLDDWVSPATLVTLKSESAIAEFIPDSEILIDLSSWHLSGAISDGTALICAETGVTNTLVLISNTTGKWLVDSLLELDENGSTRIFGAASFCL